MKRKSYVLLSLTLIAMFGGLAVWNFSANTASAQKSDDLGTISVVPEYNAANEFALTQGGTNGLWRYGYSASQADNAFTEFVTADTIPICTGQFSRWYVPNSDVVPQIAAHNLGIPCANIPPNALFIHPGQTVLGSGDPVRRAVVRWTAPASGTFQLTGSLQRQNGNATADLKIIKNAATVGESVVYSASNTTTYQISYNVSVTVAAGDKLDFSVGDGGNGYNSDGSSIVINISQPVAACLTAPANLQVFVPAENSPVDVQSVNTNASLVGDAFYTNMGKVSRAFEFDGSGDYVRVEDNPAQRPATAVTVEGWFKFDTAPGGIVSLVSKPLRNSAFNSYTLYLESGQLRGFFGNQSGQYTRVFSNFTPQAGVWHHLAFTYDFTGGISTLKLYANGAEVTSGHDGTANLPLFYDANPYPLLIGADFENNAPGFFLDGQADEVSVYGRALSQTEIFNLVKQGAFGKCPPAACALPPNNLISWFAGEGNALDSKSNNHGASQNGAAFAGGKVGQAFSLDGNNDYFSTADSPDWDFGTSDFAIEGWFNAPNPTGVQRIISAGSQADGANNLWSLGYGDIPVWGGGQRLNLAVFNGGGYSDFSSNPVTFLPNTWHHAAVVRSGSSLTFYLDGAAVGTVAVGAGFAINGGSSGAIIGARYNNNPSIVFEFANGRLDEISVYRRALSASEISSVYNANSSGKCKPSPLNPPTNQIAWFSGDGDTRDFIGLNPNGILRGDTNYRVGKVGQAFNLDGSGDYIEITDDADHRPANQLTAEGWFKFNNLNNFPHLIGVGLRGNDRNSYVMWFGNGNMRIGYSDSSSNFIFYDTGFVPLTGTFYHFAMVLNTDDAGANANTFKLYVNGAEVFNGAAANPIYYDTVNPHPLTIGADINNDVPDFSLNGLADEVSLYSRALSPSEIAAVYQAGSAGKLKSAVTPVNFSRNAKTFASLAPTVVQLSDATVTFAQVTQAGTTSESGVDLGLLPNLPSNVTFTGLAYDISTAAAYQNGTADDVQVCFNLPSLASVSNLRILHLENNVWVNRTAAGGSAANLCTDNLTSLSPFVIVQALAPTAASVSVAGKVSGSIGTGLGGVSVTLTDSQGRSVFTRTNNFGRYSFAGVRAGEVYVVSVASKRYEFAVSSQAINVQEALENVDFTATPTATLNSGKTEMR